MDTYVKNFLLEILWSNVFLSMAWHFQFGFLRKQVILHPANDESGVNSEWWYNPFVKGKLDTTPN